MTPGLEDAPKLGELLEKKAMIALIAGVLQDLMREDRIEFVIVERVGEGFEVVENVGTNVGIDINRDVFDVRPCGLMSLAITPACAE
jgi:hypothetical protein